MSQALPLRSRTGCFRCRQRRIKCDEFRPVCTRCKKGGLACVWPGLAHVTSQHLQSITTIGDLYATLFLQDGQVDYPKRDSLESLHPCPARQISPGFAPLRSATEHQTLISLSSFLAMLDQNPTAVRFEFTVALQALWVRDALLAFAGFLPSSPRAVPGDNASRWAAIQPHYTSAVAAVRRFVTEDLTETRLEQLLVASLFLGMLEISNTHNQVFPLLHFEAVGRFLEALNKIQASKTLGAAASHFHRVALESYLYHISIQSLYWPQTDRYPTIASIHDIDAASLDTKPESNRLVKLDLRIYIVLLKLTRLARVKTLNSEQQHQATEFEARIQKLEAGVLSPSPLPSPSPSPGSPVSDSSTAIIKLEASTSFRQMTLLATSALAILSAKVIDRTLLSSSPPLRTLVSTAFSRLETCTPHRQYTGDFCWFFTILACAVSTADECARLSRNVQSFSPGFFGADLQRMRQVLELVRSKRVANVKNRFATESELRENDTLSLLVEARLTLA